ncbi:hypothetical protein GCM10009544_59950 [Streptomyces stramineus]|uniref:Uncharacterized protein n=1 Tax=Streptomyces stramineus TaxID=173861 RepID=A0ABN1B6I4_9ACTN
MTSAKANSRAASVPVITVAKAHRAVSDTSGTSNSATIFRRIDFPRKRMASPTSTPVHGGGVFDDNNAARAYYCVAQVSKTSTAIELRS